MWLNEDERLSAVKICKLSHRDHTGTNSAAVE